MLFSVEFVAQGKQIIVFGWKTTKVTDACHDAAARNQLNMPALGFADYFPR
jgi:hypothetical protein